MNAVLTELLAMWECHALGTVYITSEEGRRVGVHTGNYVIRRAYRDEAGHQHPPVPLLIEEVIDPHHVVVRRTGVFAHSPSVVSDLASLTCSDSYTT
jgi:hypothetical protein